MSTDNTDKLAEYQRRVFEWLARSPRTKISAAMRLVAEALSTQEIDGPIELWIPSKHFDRFARELKHADEHPCWDRDARKKPPIDETAITCESCIGEIVVRRSPDVMGEDRHE